MNISLGISGFYDLALRNARTGEVRQLGRVRNLITDAGFDAPARYAFAKCFEVIAVGTGRTAAKTADTKLEAFVAKSTTYATGGSTIKGINFPNAADGDYTVRELFRTFLAYQNRSGAEVAIGELGVSWENVDDPTLFSRIVLTDAVSVEGAETVAQDGAKLADAALGCELENGGKSNSATKWSSSDRKEAWKAKGQSNGKAPRREVVVRNRKTGKLETCVESKELHHKKPWREGGSNDDENLEEVWPDEHEEIDPYRHIDYDVINES